MKTRNILIGFAGLAAAALLIDAGLEPTGEIPEKVYVHIVGLNDDGSFETVTSLRPPQDAIPLMRLVTKDGYNTYKYMDEDGDAWSVEDQSHGKITIQNWVATNDETGMKMRLDLTAMGFVPAVGAH
jgi:hypothetical protein